MVSQPIFDVARLMQAALQRYSEAGGQTSLANTMTSVARDRSARYFSRYSCLPPKIASLRSLRLVPIAW